MPPSPARKQALVIGNRLYEMQKDKQWGTMPHEMRNLCLKGFGASIPFLVEVATNSIPGLKTNEVLQAIDLLAKYSLGSVKGITISPENKQIAAIAIDAVDAVFGPERLHEFIEVFISNVSKTVDLGPIEDGDGEESD